MKSLGLAEHVDFGELDIETAKDIAQTVKDTKEMFPELDLKFVGSLQARNQYIANGFFKMYMDACDGRYPDTSEEELKEAIWKQVEEDMKEFLPDEGTIAQSLFLGNPGDFSETIIAQLNGITINEKYGRDYEYFKSVRKADVDAGWKPVNCYSPKATVDHELGHQIAKLVDAHNDNVIIDLFKSFSGLEESVQSAYLSGYAGKNIHEFIAEAWSEYRNNPGCRELAKNVAERIIDLYENGPKQLVKVLRR